MFSEWSSLVRSVKSGVILVPVSFCDENPPAFFNLIAGYWPQVLRQHYSFVRSLGGRVREGAYQLVNLGPRLTIMLCYVLDCRGNLSIPALREFAGPLARHARGSPVNFPERFGLKIPDDTWGRALTVVRSRVDKIEIWRS